LRLRRIVVCSVLFALIQVSAMPTLAVAQPAAAAAQTGVIQGDVLDQKTGLAIGHATVVLVMGGRRVTSATTDANGKFLFVGENPGIYSIEISAEGFGTSRADDIALVAGETVRLSTTIVAQALASQALRVIGSVSNNGIASGLQSTTVISSNISGDAIAAEGFSRVGDALTTLPGINPSPSGVHGSTIGYSLPLDIRGIGSNESQVLIDGHPVGASGASAFPGNAFYNNAPVIFDFQDSPSDALRNVQVTYGSGAVGLYGVDSIGGVIDLQTIEPTKDQHFGFNQGFGSFGKSDTNAQVTGTAGKLGYAFVSGVQGTYGEFKPGDVSQIGLIGQNQTSANIAANTYTESGDYLLRDSLGKLVYTFSPETRLTLTGYTATSWADKSGNGDDDFVTVPFQTLVANNLISQATTATPSTIVGANGATFSCVGAIAAINNAHPNGVCETANQYAAATTGPQGGGPGPWQALRNQDYHARFNTTAGINTVTVDAFVDTYAGVYNRTEAGGPSFENDVDTRGLLLSDDLNVGRNDFGFGYYTQVQKIPGTNNEPTLDGNGNVIGYASVANTEVAQQNSNFFIRDAYSLSSRVGLFFNGWEKYNSVSRSDAFDPRLSIVYKATAHDIVRLTGGRSTDSPFVGLQQGSPAFDTATNNIQPACGGLTAVGTSTNPNIQSESGTDLELAYGHNFHDDSGVQMTVYDTNVSNPIFQSVIPASTFATNPVLAQVLAALNNPTSGRYEQLCGSPASISNLVLNGPINVAGGRFRGVELGGRERINRSLFVDYGYTIQSAAYNGVTSQILQSNPFLINGAQIAGIPLHTGSAGIDYRNRKAGFEARLDGNYVGPNNSFYIGQYAYFNGFIRQSVGRYATLTLGGINIFNSDAGNFGLIGGSNGRYQPENQFFHDPSFAAEAFNEGLPENIGEAFGIPPAQFTLTLGLKM
jgi:outer membrane receptor for ferrienterochelin and colicin